MWPEAADGFIAIDGRLHTVQHYIECVVTHVHSHVCEIHVCIYDRCSADHSWPWLLLNAGPAVYIAFNTISLHKSAQASVAISRLSNITVEQYRG